MSSWPNQNGTSVSPGSSTLESMPPESMNMTESGRDTEAMQLGGTRRGRHGRGRHGAGRHGGRSIELKAPSQRLAHRRHGGRRTSSGWAAQPPFTVVAIGVLMADLVAVMQIATRPTPAKPNQQCSDDRSNGRSNGQCIPSSSHEVTSMCDESTGMNEPAPQHTQT